ncbi:glycerophosphodiester phosphodiesterase [Gracilimonas tropica]|uniref:glycerophosphodiester phosphodiesterase n=1 Tax=Gracilimonas tropica TaxID=454600 RepID=UPI00037212A2|nr:glycerophosphodiester phosphodiesterase family protein [Gracilimonas tropica]
MFEDKDSEKPIKHLHLEVNTYKENSSDFLIIAHRGASIRTPENTMSSVREAYHQNADIVEIDVVFTKDLVPVVFHDDTLGRTTNGIGKVKDFTLQELKKLDAGVWFSDDFKGEKIPTLHEVLNYCKGRLAVMIEIKEQNSIEVSAKKRVELLIKEINEFNMNNFVSVSSVTPQFIVELNYLNNDIARGIVLSKHHFHDIYIDDIIMKYTVDFIIEEKNKIESYLCEILSNKPTKLFLHTVNSKDELDRIVNCTLNGILTDNPKIFNQ